MTVIPGSFFPTKAQMEDLNYRVGNREVKVSDIVKVAIQEFNYTQTMTNQAKSTSNQCTQLKNVQTVMHARYIKRDVCLKIILRT